MFVENKVAIITGGATGVGLQYAKALLKGGLRGVTLADVNTLKGEQAQTELAEDFGPDKVLFVKTDVADKSQLENAFKMTIEQFQNLDIVINNAGVMNDSIWEKQIDINLKGTIYGCLLAMEEYLPKYKSGREGVVVNIASVLGIMGISVLPFYAATKHAVVGLSRSLSRPDQYESTNVRILTICPGATDTPLLADLERKALNERYLNMLGKHDTPTPQKSEEVAKCLMKILEEGGNGSIWVVEDGEIYEIEIPEGQQLKKK